ncbi:MAG: ATP-binding protein [Deltaproteobacteria bacterium]|nr:ATP-binding protein [Deltaproteobacteria bacterium]
MVMKRYLLEQVTNDLKKKMVFVGGPRQVGKTTLARQILKQLGGDYFNWDTRTGREKILKQKFSNVHLWVFDEIHKYRKWRNYLKGLFDEHGTQRQILVTGSARLDLYRRGGDSLQGRYHYLRLHPLSVAELGIKTKDDFRALLTLGGFPEPFFSGSETESRRWSREYRERLIQDDLRSLEQVVDLGNFELLMMRLPALVGSPLSINALREDLQLSHRTVKTWIAILERLYHLFTILPYGAPAIRSVTKERKHYHTNWALIRSEGARLENLVACHLLKWIHYKIDTEGWEYELRYLRDRNGREVDFVITLDNKPLKIIECKLSKSDVDPSLLYFKERLKGVEAVQLVMNTDDDFITHNGVRVCSVLRFLSEWI